MLFSILHIIHLLTVILWIGGLAFVTTMIFPMLLKTQNALEKVLLFRRIEHRFARVARAYNVIVGVTGFAMLFTMGWHKTLLTRPGIPLLIMTLIWVFWFVMLFGLEPVLIKKMLDNMAKSGDKLEIDTIFAKMNRMHWLMLFISLVAAAAGAVFAHGLL